MLKSLTALSLTLLLIASPGLSVFLPLVCCCDDGVPGFHLDHTGHAGSGHTLGDDHAHSQVSHHSDEDAEDRHGSNRDHDSDAGHELGLDLVATTGSDGLLPTSCTCRAADLPTSAVLMAGITNRAASKLAPGHLGSSVEIAPQRRFIDKVTVNGRDLSSPEPPVFLLNRSLLI